MHQLDGVGDHVTGREAVLHALGAHGHAVGDDGRVTDVCEHNKQNLSATPPHATPATPLLHAARKSSEGGAGFACGLARLAARLLDGVGDGLRELVEVVVAARGVGVRGSDGDQRLLDVVLTPAPHSDERAGAATLHPGGLVLVLGLAGELVAAPLELGGVLGHAPLRLLVCHAGGRWGNGWGAVGSWNAVTVASKQHNMIIINDLCGDGADGRATGDGQRLQDCIVAQGAEERVRSPRRPNCSARVLVKVGGFEAG